MAWLSAASARILKRLKEFIKLGKEEIAERLQHYPLSQLGCRT